MTTKTLEALKTLTEFVTKTRNLDDPALKEIQDAVETVNDYIATYEI